MSYPVPCQPCQDEGGYRIKPGGIFHPPSQAFPPYTGQEWFTDANGKRIECAWPYVPMCPVHAHETVEREWRQRNMARAKGSAA
jgi:hypothetical protein